MKGASPLNLAAAARALLPLVWLCSGGLLAGASSASALPDFNAVRAAHTPSDLVFTDRHGEPLQTLRTDPTRRVLAWVSLEDMSPALLEALVRSEDRRFWSHAGVDWGALAALSLIHI